MILSHDPRHLRWTQLVHDIQTRRLTRVVAPAGYSKTAFAAYILFHTPHATRITFGYSHSTLHSALNHVAQGLELDPNVFELPNILSGGRAAPPSHYARILEQDMSHPSLDGRILILDDVHLLERSATTVLLHIALAKIFRLNLIVCVRHPDEFPADQYYGLSISNITEAELAYTQAELDELTAPPDPYGYPALAQASRQGVAPGLYMRHRLDYVPDALRRELQVASVIPSWPLTPEQAAVLNLRGTLVYDALSADLPIIRITGTEQYVPHPALHGVLSSELRQNEALHRDTHERLSRLNALTDPVLAVRHAVLAHQMDRAVEIAREWLALPAEQTDHLADDLLLELLPVEALLPTPHRVRVAQALGRRERSAEAIMILRSLQGAPDPDDLIRLSLARIYLHTGAYASALEQIHTHVPTTTNPFLKAFAAHLIVTVHAHTGQELISPNLDRAHEWAVQAFKDPAATPDAQLLARPQRAALPVPPVRRQPQPPDHQHGTPDRHGRLHRTRERRRAHPPAPRPDRSRPRRTRRDHPRRRP